MESIAVQIMLLFFATIGIMEVIAIIMDEILARSCKKVQDFVAVLYSDGGEDGAEVALGRCRTLLEEIKTTKGAGARILLVDRSGTAEGEKALRLLADDYENVTYLAQDPLLKCADCN